MKGEKWKNVTISIWGSHGGDYEVCDFLGCNKCNSDRVRRFGGRYHFHLQGQRVSREKITWKSMNWSKLAAWLLMVYFLAYFSILKMEAICSSETCGSFRTTRRHIQYYSDLHSHHIENPKFHIFLYREAILHTLVPWRWRQYVSPKRRLIPTGLLGVTSKKMSPTWGYCFISLYRKAPVRTFIPWSWNQYDPPKRRWIYIRVHGVIFHKTVMFILKECEERKRKNKERNIKWKRNKTWEWKLH
jgi:hypothetical protein